MTDNGAAETDTYPLKYHYFVLPLSIAAPPLSKPAPAALFPAAYSDNPPHLISTPALHIQIPYNPI